MVTNNERFNQFSSLLFAFLIQATLLPCLYLEDKINLLGHTVAYLNRVLLLSENVSLLFWGGREIVINILSARP